MRSADGGGRRSSTRSALETVGVLATSATCGPRIVVPEAGRRNAPRQSAPRGAPGDAAGAEPVFPVEPSVSATRSICGSRTCPGPGVTQPSPGCSAMPKRSEARRSSTATGSCRSSCARSNRSGRAFAATRLSTTTLYARGSSSSATRASACSRNVMRGRGRRGRRATGVLTATAVREVIKTDRTRVDFHRWMQWSHRYAAREGRPFVAAGP